MLNLLTGAPVGRPFHFLLSRSPGRNLAGRHPHARGHEQEKHREAPLHRGGSGLLGDPRSHPRPESQTHRQKESRANLDLTPPW